MLQFTAILLHDVFYSDFTGNEVKVPQGTPVIVTRAAADAVSTTLDGEALSEAGAFFATRDGITFDVAPTEFQPVHHC